MVHREGADHSSCIIELIGRWMDSLCTKDMIEMNVYTTKTKSCQGPFDDLALYRIYYFSKNYIESQMSEATLPLPRT